MARDILSLAVPAKSDSAAYRLLEKHRQTILAKADNPVGRIGQKNLSAIERQRLAFIQKNGNEFGI